MSTEPSPPNPIEDQLRALNGSVDRLLILAMDHAQAIDEVKADVREVKADIREVKADVREVRANLRGLQREVSGIHEAFTEHLGWHLGRGGAA